MTNPSPKPRRFEIHRDIDLTGVSGTGHVADGVVFSDSTAAVRWLGETPSTATWISLDHAIAEHGHADTTYFVFLDQPGPADEPEEIRDLPPEVRQLLHAVDAIRDDWAEADDARKHALWRRVHAASDAVWGRA